MVANPSRNFESVLSNGWKLAIFLTVIFFVIGITTNNAYAVLPVAVDDFNSTLKNTPVIIDVLANDYDLDNDTLSISAVSPTSHGGIAVIQSEKILYTPPLGFVGTDSFSYVMTDSVDGTASATVTVQINPYPITPLIGLNGTYGAQSINTAGEMVGCGNNSTGYFHALYWINYTESPQDLGVLPSGATSCAYSINALEPTGQIVGSGLTSNSNTHALFWSNYASLPQDLGLLSGGNYSDANSINLSGQIVGEGQSSSGFDHAIFWSSNSSAPQDLGLLSGGNQSYANSINLLGQIVGHGQNSLGFDRALFWSSYAASPQDLGVLPGGSNSYAKSINSIGQIVGFGTNSTGYPRALFWSSNSTSPQDLGVLPGGTTSFATSINSKGEIVGYGNDASGNTRALFWLNSTATPQDLGTLYTDQISQAISINDQGKVVGISAAGNEAPNTAVLWNTPLLSSLSEPLSLSDTISISASKSSSLSEPLSLSDTISISASKSSSLSDSLSLSDVISAPTPIANYLNIADDLNFTDSIITIKGAAPTILNLTAANPNANGYVDGATITIQFDEATSKRYATETNNNLQKSDVDNLFSFVDALQNPISIGNDYNGTWFDASTFVITIKDPGSVTSPDLINNLKVQVKSSAGLTNAEKTSGASSSISPVLQGDFGKPESPYIKAFVVSDPNDGPSTFHAGDVFSIVFSTQTNEPGGTGTLNKAIIDSMFSFSPSLGTTTYTGTWTTSNVFTITINSVDDSNPPIIGSSRVQVISTNLKNAEETSNPSASLSPPLSGSFGIFTVIDNVNTGGTAVTTLPSGITTTVTLPDTGSGLVSFVQTTASTSSPTPSTQLEFLGTPVDISLPPDVCTPSCQFSFQFTNDDLAASGLTNPSDVVIYHDHNTDGDFVDNGESLATTVTTLSPGFYLASATDSHTSKFAVGGVVKVLFILHKSESGGATAPQLYGKMFTSGEYPLTINGQGFKLDSYTNKIPTSVMLVGQPSNLKLLLSQSGGLSSLDTVILFMNVFGSNPNSADSDTYIEYQNGLPTQIRDPNGFFKQVSVNATTVNDKIQFNYEITFAKPMQKSDMIIRAWDINKYSSNEILLDAIEAVNPPATLNDKVPSVNTEQNNIVKIEQTSPSYIPSWVKDNAKLWSNGSINEDNFVTGLQYMIQNNIIKVPVTNTNTQSQNIPYWVKNNAKWWADSEITDNEFIQSIQYLISSNIVRIGK